MVILSYLWEFMHFSIFKMLEQPYNPREFPEEWQSPLKRFIETLEKIVLAPIKCRFLPRKWRRKVVEKFTKKTTEICEWILAKQNLLNISQLVRNVLWKSCRFGQKLTKSFQNFQTILKFSDLLTMENWCFSPIWANNASSSGR